MIFFKLLSALLFIAATHTHTVFAVNPLDICVGQFHLLFNSGGGNGYEARVASDRRNAERAFVTAQKEKVIRKQMETLNNWREQCISQAFKKHPEEAERSYPPYNKLAWFHIPLSTRMGYLGNLLPPHVRRIEEAVGRVGISKLLSTLEAESVQDAIERDGIRKVANRLKDLR